MHQQRIIKTNLQIVGVKMKIISATSHNDGECHQAGMSDGGRLRTRGGGWIRRGTSYQIYTVALKKEIPKVFFNMNVLFF